MRVQKAEVQEALTKAELAKAELELEINRLRIEDLTLRDNLLKLQALNEQLIHEKQDLQKTLDSFEAGACSCCSISSSGCCCRCDRTVLVHLYLCLNVYVCACVDRVRLSSDKQQLEQEKSGIKEELIRTEQEKLQLDVEKSSVSHSLEMTEMHRSRLEAELSQANREKLELAEKLNAIARQRAVLQEELQHQKAECERCQATIIKLLREKEATNRELISCKHDVAALDEEGKQQADVIAQLRSEKGALESSLYDTQTVPLLCCTYCIRTSHRRGHEKANGKRICFVCVLFTRCCNELRSTRSRWRPNAASCR